jgi:hypothetical protein
MDYSHRDYAPSDPTEVIYCTKDHKFRYMKRSELFNEDGRLSNTPHAQISISLPNVSSCRENDRANFGATENNMRTFPIPSKRRHIIVDLHWKSDPERGIWGEEYVWRRLKLPFRVWTTRNMGLGVGFRVLYVERDEGWSRPKPPVVAMSLPGSELGDLEFDED